METAEDMKAVVETIVSSYQSRVPAVAKIIDNIHGILEDLKSKRNEMNDHLREVFAKEESMRGSDFDNMTKGIMSHQEERENEIRDRLGTLLNEQQEAAEIIRKTLADPEELRIDEFTKMLQDVQVRQKARESEASTMLRQYQEDYRQMAESLRGLLHKGKAIRIRDLKEMVEDLRTGQIERASTVEARLNEFKEQHQRTASRF